MPNLDVVVKKLGLLILTWITVGGIGFAATWEAGVLAGSGVLQQPSSQYYLLAYSAHAFLEYSPAKAGLGITAVGRPKFAASGYEEQDFGGMIEIRKGVFEKGRFALGASVGGGQMRGYVKSTAEDGARSDYRMGGPSVTFDIQYAGRSTKGFTARLSHTMFAGLSKSAQTDARVAWPWTMFMLGVGYRS